jgi:hypothetical protein
VRSRLFALCLILAVAIPGAALAQDTAATPADTTGAPRTESTEAVDRTRLDVERLPPEAIHVTRDLYAHGFFVEAALGARGFIGGIGRYSDPGFAFWLRAGYEILDWLWVSAVFESSIHQTHAPTPPSQAVFELLGAMGEVRLQTNPTAELALWLSGQAGMIVATTDAPALYGIQNASTVGLAYGGEIGIEAHFHSRHTSIGLLGGTRLATNLQSITGEMSIGIHGGPYLRYVF